MLIIIGVGQDALDFREHQFVGPRIVVDFLAGEIASQRRARLISGSWLVRALNNDARPHPGLV